MKRLWLCLSAGLILSCGGNSGGGSLPVSNGVPTISNLFLTPDIAVQNDGGGTVQAELAFDFHDGDGDVTTLRVIDGSQHQDLAINGTAGVKDGYVSGYFTFSTATIGTFQFQVKLVDGKGQASKAVNVTFAVKAPPPPAPYISTISPLSTVAGGPGFALIVNGSNFYNNSVVLWNGSPRSTTFVSSNELQATITGQDIASTGTAIVTVRNSDSEGGVSGESISFTIGNINTILVNLPANDILWDSVHNVIYASLPSSAGSHGNSIAAINPVTGNITASVSAGSEPNRLALSDDSQFLYVGMNGTSSVQRFTLPALTKDISIPLGSSPGLGPSVALDIQVAPGTPKTIAVSLGDLGMSPVAQGGIVIFDDATPRTSTVPGGIQLFDSLQWSPDATTLYGADTESIYGCHFYILNADSNGVSLTDDVPGVFTSSVNSIHYDKSTNLIYVDSGQVLNPATGQPSGTFRSNSSGPMTLDPSQTMAFFYNRYGDPTLQSFNLTRFTPMGSSTIVPLDSSPLSAGPNRLFRWGTDGLILGGAGNPIYIFSGPFVLGQPTTTPVGALNISSINPLTAIAGGPAFTLQVHGTNFLRDSIINWNQSPKPTTFISNTLLQAEITAQDIAAVGTASVTVPNADGWASYEWFFSIANFNTNIVDLPANDILGDSARGVIYASLPSTAGANGNSIAVIDPTTGNIVSTTFAGSEPDRLALSDDGQFLYVGLDGASEVQRFSLPSLTKDIAIPLGSDPFYGPHTAIDIQVAPSAPHTIAVSLGVGINPSNIDGGLVIFDDATPRPNRAIQTPGGGYIAGNSLQWGTDTTKLYGAESESSSFDFYILSVDSNGVSLAQDIYSEFSSYRNLIHFDKSTGLIYADSGEVLVPATGQIIGNYQIAGTMTPDPSQTLAFFLSDGTNGELILRSFHQTQFTPIGSISVPAREFFLPIPNRLIRFGHDGLVFGGKGNLVYIVSGSFVQGH